jgi:predicted component of type VI protein secretion system
VIIEQTWIVGRADDCDVRVTDDYASPHHCQVARTTEGDFYVRDLGSTNGTWVHLGGEGRKAIGWTRIWPGEALVVGRSIIPWTPTT